MQEPRLNISNLSLALTNLNTCSKQVFKFVEAKEAGRRSASKLMDSQGAESASSSYCRNQNADGLKVDKPQLETREVCSYCGKTGHGVGLHLAYVRKNVWHMDKHAKVHFKESLAVNV